MQTHSFQFESVNDALLLAAAGFEATYYPATWEDVGGPESGPRIEGGPSWVEWSNGDHYVIVSQGAVRESGRFDPNEFVPF